MRTLLVLIAVFFGGSLIGQRTPDPLDHAKEIQVYDVREVLAKALRLRPAPEGGPGRGERAGAVPTGAAPERVAAVVGVLRRALSPPLADPTCMQPLGSGLLVVRGTPEQHIALQGILREWSKAEDLEVAVEVRCFRVANGDFADALGKVLGGPLAEAADIQRVFAAADAKRVSELLARCQGSEPFDPMHLRLLPGQLGIGASPQTVRYRKDYEVELVGRTPKVWPVTGEIADGLRAEVCAMPIDAATSAIFVDASWQKVRRPIATFTTTLAGDSGKLELDLPEAIGSACAATVRLRSGELGMVVGRAQEDGTRYVILVETHER